MSKKKKKQKRNSNWGVPKNAAAYFDPHYDEICHRSRLIYQENIMKKAKYFIATAFAVEYAAFLGLLTECVLNIFSICCGISFNSRFEYPRFFPFCVIVGLFSLAALVLLLIYNISICEKFNYTKRTWWTQMISAFALSIPAIKLFDMLFELLQKIF